MRPETVCSSVTGPSLGLGIITGVEVKVTRPLVDSMGKGLTGDMVPPPKYRPLVPCGSKSLNLVPPKPSLPHLA